MNYAEFMKEFAKRIENKYLHHVHEVNTKASRAEQEAVRKIPIEVLMATFKAGAISGVKTMSEMASEGMTVDG